MMLIISRCKIRAIKYTQQRELRDLAQRKLFDRIHYLEPNDSGDFTDDGHPTWTWNVSPPEMVGNGETVILQYAIEVHTPQRILSQAGPPDDSGLALDGGSSSSDSGQEGDTYTLSVWTLPDDRWYEEQQVLYDQGYYSPLYGDPNFSGGGLTGGLGY